MIRKNKHLRRLLLVVSMILSTLILSNRTFAISSNEVFTRILINNLKTCYNSALVSNIAADSYNGFDSMLNDGYAGDGGTTIRIPDLSDSYNKVTRTDNGGRVISCKNLFVGGSGWFTNMSMTGLFDIFNVAVPTSNKDMGKLNTFMVDKLNYDATATQGDNHCFELRVKGSTTTSEWVSLGSYCRYDGDSGDGFFTLSGGDSDYSASANFTVSNRELNVDVYKNGCTVKYRGNSEKCRKSFKFSVGDMSGSEYIGEERTTNSHWPEDEPGLSAKIIVTKDDGGDGSSRNVLYKKKAFSDEVIKKITGGKYEGTAPFSDGEKYGFYTLYLKEYYGFQGVSDNGCQTNKPSTLVDTANGKYYIFSKGSGWCPATLASDKVNEEHAMSVFAGNGRTILNKVIKTLPELINLMGALDYSNEDEFSSVNQLMTDNTSSYNANDCSGLELSGQGWILCPVLENGATTADGFTTMINNMLEVKSELYNNDSGTYKAWEIFRNFANVVLSIILLAIIFSQVTGYGINNYGIKKMLPKFVVMAIMINLSFIVCQIAVDLSNVFGSGLNNLLRGIAVAINGGDLPGWWENSFISNLVSGVLGLLGAAGAAGGLAVTVATIAISGEVAPLLIISLILGIAAALVGILIFFVSLGARMVIIITFIAIAPLAFACYILPNTQTLFKRWWGVFKAALVVFPICGALYGASLVIKAIFLRSGTVELWEGVILTIVPFLPFFALPNLLRGTLSGLGAVSGMLNSIGNGLRGGLQGGRQAMEGTDAYRSQEKRVGDMAAFNRALRFRNREDNRIANGLGEKDRRRLTELRDKIRSNRATDKEKDEYGELVARSSYRPNEQRQHRLAEANATIEEHEKRLDEDRLGVDDAVVAGRIEGNRYSAEKSAEDARDWGKSFFRDNDGNVWTEGRSGRFETVDRNGNRQTMTAERVRELVQQRQGAMVSRREALANKDQVERARQTGQLSGYANASRAQAAAYGNMMSSIEDSRESLIQSAQAGQDNVLKVQHDTNVERRRQVAGRAEASAEARAQGLSTVTSVEAAKQAAQNQIVNVSAQNAAAADSDVRAYYNSQANMAAAVDAGAIGIINKVIENQAQNAVGEVKIDSAVAQRKAQNKFNLDVAQNNVDVVPEISPEYAETLTKRRFDTAQERMYSEQLVTNSRPDSVWDLKGAFGEDLGTNRLDDKGNPRSGTLHQNDQNYILAAMKDIVSKGGIEDLNKAIKDNSRSFTPETAKTVSGYMATLSVEPVMKVYGKYASRGGHLSYDGWLRANDAGKDLDPGGEYSLAGFIRANGDTVLANASKDTFKFYDGDDGLRGKFSPLQIVTGAINARDNETRDAADRMLKSRIDSGTDDEVRRAIEGLSALQWASMEDSTFIVLENRCCRGGRPLPAFESAFRDVKERVREAGGTIQARLRPSVKKFLDSVPGTAGGGGSGLVDGSGRPL